MSTPLWLLVVFVALGGGVFIGLLVDRVFRGAAYQTRDEILAQANKDGEGIRKAAELASKEDLIKRREQLLGPLADAIRVAADRIVTCTRCGNVDTSDPCALCSDPRRDGSVLVVVEDVSDLWALERAQVVNARYHVLGGTLSALDGVGPQDLDLDRLVMRAAEPGVVEVILAVNATVDGQTTAHYITDMLSHLPLKVTRLAHGVPVGGELDYLDEGTLTAAFRQRTSV
jgi:recombination protein RecR